MKTLEEKALRINRYVKVLAAAAVSTALVAAVWLKTGIYFETNDDRLITEILSGVIGGEPAAQTVYVNGLLSVPLSLLYRITGNVPWYGICLIAFQILVYTLLFGSIWDRCDSKRQRGAAALVVTGFFLLNLHLVGLIQYTSTAVMLALAGYVCLLLRKNRRIGLLLFGMATLLSFSLRSSSALAVQPLGMAVYTGFIFLQKDICLKNKIVQLLRPVMILAAVFLIGAVSNAVVYSAGEWQKFQNHAEANVPLFDYYGGPPYEEVEEILNKYGVTRAEYEAYLNNIIFDWNMTPECASEIAEYAKNHNTVKTPAEAVKEYWQYRWQKHYWGVNRIAVILCAAAFFGIFLWKQYNLLLPFGFLQAAKLAIWFYLIYKGRMPLRVVFPLFACETAFLLIMIFQSILRSTRPTKWKIAGVLVFGCFFLGVSFSSGRQQYRYVKEQNTGQKIFMEGMRELEDYCREHPENKYLMDAVSMSYYKGSALETEIYQPRNSTVTGCWYSNSPVMEAFQREYLKADGRGLHLIVYEDGKGVKNPAVAYLQEETGTAPELVETFTASHGGTYLIWYFPGEITFDGK